MAAVSATIIWGVVAIPLRDIQQYPSQLILCHRAFIALIITWAIILLFGRHNLARDLAYMRSESDTTRKRICLLVVLNGLLLGSNWLVFIYAINHVSLKSAAFAYMICPLLTAMGGFLILKEQLSKNKFIAIGIALVSLIICAQGSVMEVLWSTFIAATFAFYLIIQRMLIQLNKLNMLGVQLGIVTLLVLPIFLCLPEKFPADTVFWSNISAIAILFTVIPLLLSAYALIKVPSSTFGIMIYLNPVVAFLVAFIYFGEGIRQDQLYAYSLLLLSVILFNWDMIGKIFDKQIPPTLGRS